MKRLWIILAGIVIAICIVGAIVSITHSKHQPSTTQNQQQTTGTGNSAVGATGASSVVTYSDTGFSPSPLTIAVGTTVTWSNESSHTLKVQRTGALGAKCTENDPTELNECTSISKGGSYSYTFTKRGTFTYFNYDSITDTGTVTVTEASTSGPIRANTILE